MRLNVKVLLVIVPIVIMAASIYYLFGDIIFFATKTETQGRILGIENMGSQEPYAVTVSYFNEFLKKEIQCIALFKKSYRDKLLNKQLQPTTVYYGRMFPKRIFLPEIKRPAKGEMVIELGLIVLMIISIRGILNDARKSSDWNIQI